MELVHRPRSVFDDAAEEFIRTRRSPKTQEVYRSDLQKWRTFCDHYRVDPRFATLAQARLYRDGLITTYAPSSVRRMLAVLASIYDILFRTGVVTANPFFAKVLPRPEASTTGTTEIIPNEVAVAMIAAAERSPRDTAILRLLYDVGLRRASIATARRRHLQGNQLTVTVKGGRTEVAALPAVTLAAVQAWLAVAPPSTFLFPARGPQDASMHEGTINKIVSRYAAAVGHRFHPHCFRVAFITEAYDAGLPDRQVQGAVHHRDPKTTQRYDRHARGGDVAEVITARRRKETK